VGSSKPLRNGEKNRLKQDTRWAAMLWRKLVGKDTGAPKAHPPAVRRFHTVFYETGPTSCRGLPSEPFTKTPIVVVWKYLFGHARLALKKPYYVLAVF